MFIHIFVNDCAVGGAIDGTVGLHYGATLETIGMVVIVHRDAEATRDTFDRQEVERRPFLVIEKLCECGL